MRGLMIFCMLITGMVSNADWAKGIQQKIQTADVASIKLYRSNGDSRIFKETDGYEEVVINKVITWINAATISERPLKEVETPLSRLNIKMKNGDIAVIEPAYQCISRDNEEVCSLADGEDIYSSKNDKVRLKSRELFDWFLVGWKYESVGALEEELLEETLYARYFSNLDKYYSDFIMCPKIDRIKRIDGDTRKHIVDASALNYSAHHGDIPYDRIHITLMDTPESGVEIDKVFVEKSISAKESRIQCRREY